jgi:hypothetical protein
VVFTCPSPAPDGSGRELWARVARARVNQICGPFRIIAWPAWIITTLIIAPVLSGSQKKYEYEADAAAAAIGLAAPLASALRTMGAFETGRTGWERAITATHPPIELRVEALQDRLPDDAEYEEDELRGPTREEIVRLLTFWRRRL